MSHAMGKGFSRHIWTVQIQTSQWMHIYSLIWAFGLYWYVLQYPLILTVNVWNFEHFITYLFGFNFAFHAVLSYNTWWNCKQCRPWSDCSSGAVWSVSTLFADAFLVRKDNKFKSRCYFFLRNFNPCCAEWIKIPRPLLTVSQSDCLS